MLPILKKLNIKFNEGDRKDALRDLCEIVELETYNLAKKAADKGWINKSINQIDHANWNSRINFISSNDIASSGHRALLTNKFSQDMHSFRGARNLFNHPAKTIKDQNDRKVQYKERMIQGPRLLSTLLVLKRKVK